MAKIIYGVSGQGFGHSTRSKVVLEHLVKQGHQVLVYTYGQGLFFLGQSKLWQTFEIPGLKLIYKENKVIYWKTICKNTLQLAKQSRHWKLMLEKCREFKPDLIITDFEPMTALLATIQRLPLISVDNIHQLTNTRITVPAKNKKDLLADKLVVRSMVWNANYYLIASFFKSSVCRKNTFIFPPIVRNEVLNLTTEEKNYFLVYQTADSEKIIKVLKTLPDKFIFFGKDMEKIDDNITFKKFSQEEWLKCLANCQGIIASAGFSLISEALYLKKPYLAIPITKQVEQIINAQYLQKLGYGLFAPIFSEAAFNTFKTNLPKYKSKLSQYKQKDNKEILAKLDKIIDFYAN